MTLNALLEPLRACKKASKGILWLYKAYECLEGPLKAFNGLLSIAKGLYET